MLKIISFKKDEIKSKGKEIRRSSDFISHFRPMESDNEQKEVDGNRRDIELKVGRFREQSQLYLKRLPVLKRQLRDISRLHQFDLYVKKLGRYLFSSC